MPPGARAADQAGRVALWFWLVLLKKIVRKLYPFDRAMDADAAFLKACLDDDDVKVCSIRDAGGSMSSGSPWYRNGPSRWTPCSSAYLEASPVGRAGGAGIQRRAVEARFICVGRRGAGRGRRGRGDAVSWRLEPAMRGFRSVVCVRLVVRNSSTALQAAGRVQSCSIALRMLPWIVRGRLARLARLEVSAGLVQFAVRRARAAQCVPMSSSVSLRPRGGRQRGEGLRVSPRILIVFSFRSERCATGIVLRKVSWPLHSGAGVFDAATLSIDADRFGCVLRASKIVYLLL